MAIERETAGAWWVNPPVASVTADRKSLPQPLYSSGNGHQCAFVSVFVFVFVIFFSVCGAASFRNRQRRNGEWRTTTSKGVSVA